MVEGRAIKFRFDEKRFLELLGGNKQDPSYKKVIDNLLLILEHSYDGIVLSDREGQLRPL